MINNKSNNNNYTNNNNNNKKTIDISKETLRETAVSLR